jgi:hypothetical protein
MSANTCPGTRLKSSRLWRGELRGLLGSKVGPKVAERKTCFGGEAGQMETFVPVRTAGRVTIE